MAKKKIMAKECLVFRSYGIYELKGVKKSRMPNRSKREVAGDEKDYHRGKGKKAEVKISKKG